MPLDIKANLEVELATFEPAVQEIAQLHASILDHARTSVSSAIRIGEILTQVKAASKHGDWLPWLEANVPFSQKTAWNYMECFRRRDELENITNLTDAYAKALVASSNGEQPGGPPQLHESNFYTNSIRLTQRLMGDINHELKDRPIDSWGKDNWITLAAALEPLAELYSRLKSLLA